MFAVRRCVSKVQASQMSSERRTEEWLSAYQARRGLRMELVSVEPKKNKYGNKKTEVDNIVFASKREATRYQDLKVMQREGLITGLTLQPKYPLEINGIKIGSYIGDFFYTENGQRVVEDTKGVKTPVYKLKRRLMLALYGIHIRET